MQIFTDVRSSADQVEALEINSETVIVRSGIERVEEQGTEEMQGFSGWHIAKETVYSKDEYIKLVSEENANLSATVDSILTEVIPSMMGV